MSGEYGQMIGVDEILNSLPDGPEFTEAADVLSRISRLDRDRLGNLGKLLTLHSQLAAILRHGPHVVASHSGIREWVAWYGEELNDVQGHIRLHLGIDLESELEKQGLALSGHYPLLKAGLFTLETDFSRYRVVVWYGPKQERLVSCPPVAARVGKQLSLVRDRLGGGMNSDYFKGMLEGAYESCTGNLSSGVVSLRDILDRLVSPAKAGKGSSGVRRLSRADVSYNFFRFSTSLLQDGLRLTVASRSFTRNKKDFLWIPDSESGAGSYYSHMEFRRTKL